MPPRPTDKLAPYRAKRDFSKTREPAGDPVAADAGTVRRFVIQKHDATRLHYDLRLELDGVFKSWAVTRGPSIDPHEKRLAVEVEDHPLDYGDFEGTIPKGEYGGGTVLLWDRGVWAPEGMDPTEGLAKGDLKFRLEGEKLHGSWVLVRMKHDRSGGKRVNWLLIKHRDEWSRDGEGETVLEQDRSVASKRSMAEIAAGRGRKPTPFITKDPPATSSLPEFVPPFLATSVERPPTGPGWVHEIKLDGYRMQLRVARGEAILRTRTGLDWTHRFQALAQAAAALPDGLYDGEVVALDAEGRPDFAGLQAALGGGQDKPLVFFVFDLLFADGIDLRAWTLSDRKARLRQALEGAPVAIRYVDHFETGGDAVLLSACRMHLEGIVSKRADGPYRSGRSEEWQKSKCRAGHEVVVGGWATTDGRFRSLLVGAQRDGQFVYLGRVGTGFGAAKVSRLLPALEAVEQKSRPFSGPNAPKPEARVHWTRPELVAEIEFAGLTSEGLLRQASFKGLREDKPAAQVVPDRVPAGNVVFGVTISRPEKIFWPEAGGDGTPVTKLDLARFYEVIADRLLPHLIGRPCSLLRYPDGIAGERFFQRHPMKGQSALIDVVSVSGDRQPYVVLNRKEALAAAAQVGALELHPWNNVPHEFDQPGRLVFDLDPAPDVPFARVIEGAFALREVLEARGLATFCKTTGGKGLHVVVPLAPERSPLDWPTAKAFARGICQELADSAPDRYLITMAKKDRTGRIFLDYLRNDRMSTAVAPYSPRARPGAPVSMPIAWSEVRAGLDPLRFHLRSVPGLLREPDPWRDYAKAARPLSTALRPGMPAGKRATRM